MTRSEFESLMPGDVIRGKVSGMAFIVHCVEHRHGETTALLIRTSIATNPEEWELLSKTSVRI